MSTFTQERKTHPDDIKCGVCPQVVDGARDAELEAQQHEVYLFKPVMVVERGPSDS